jgi:hypothetical protein
MQVVVYIYVAIAAALGAIAGTPGGTPPGPTGLSASPDVVATLEPSCTEAVPVPTIPAEVTNHGAAPLGATVHRDGVEIAVLYVAPGQTESASTTSPHWEDVANLF